MNIKQLYSVDIEGSDFLYLSPDNNIFVSTNWEEKLIINDINKKKIVKTLSIAPYSSYIKSIDINFNYIVGVKRRSISVFTRKGYKKVNSLKGHKSDIVCLKLINSSKLLSGDEDGYVILWDLTKGIIEKKIKLPRKKGEQEGKKKYLYPIEIVELGENKGVISIIGYERELIEEYAKNGDNYTVSLKSERYTIWRYHLLEETLEKIDQFTSKDSYSIDNNHLYIYKQNKYIKYDITFNTVKDYKLPDLKGEKGWDISKQKYTSPIDSKISLKMIVDNDLIIGANLNENIIQIKYKNNNLQIFSTRNSTIDFKDFDISKIDNTLYLIIYQEDICDDIYKANGYRITLE